MNQLLELLDAAKINIWEANMITGDVFDFGYSESLASVAGFKQAPEDIDTFIARLHPNDKDRVQTAITKAFTNKSDYYAEFRIKLLSGNYAWVMATGRYIIDETGQAYKLVGIWKFITHEKQREEELYNQRVALNRLSRALFVGELTAIVTHQIAQPLSAIEAYLAASINFINSNEASKDELLSLLKSSKEQARLITRVIKQIKNFIVHGELKYENVNINKLISKAISLLNLPQHSIIEIEFTPATEIQEIELDYYQITQVIQNLLYNSVEALHAISDYPPRITIKLSFAQDLLKITIQDNGPGITDEALAQLYNPFYTEKDDGMGLGIALCQKIIEKHNGSLKLARGSEGFGTTAIITLPVMKGI